MITFIEERQMPTRPVCLNNNNATNEENHKLSLNFYIDSIMVRLSPFSSPTFCNLAGTYIS